MNNNKLLLVNLFKLTSYFFEVVMVVNLSIL